MSDTRLATDTERSDAHVRFKPALMKVLVKQASRRRTTVPELIRQLVTERLEEMGVLK